MRGKPLNASRKNHQIFNQPGFSLIATISILVLLALIAVGLLSLSSVTLRASSQQAGLSEARANARMALLMAIGELQRQAGPDQRITASATILSDPGSQAGSGNAHWTGVWKSWTAGTDNEVDEVSSHSTIGRNARGLSPTYEDGREDHFLSWLVSGRRSQTETLNSATGSQTDPINFPNQSQRSVLLVGQGTLGDSADTSDFVAGDLVEVEEGGQLQGRFGWWVGDESIKAPLTPDPYEDANGLSEALVVERSQAPAQSASWLIDGLDHVQNPEVSQKLFSHATLGVKASTTDAPKRAFHHSSPWSRGVLADVRGGGLKRDLSALLDRRINTRDTGDEFMLYRFANGQNERVPVQDLAAYYQLYRDHLKTRSGGLSRSEQVVVANFQRETFTRSYSNLYRMPVPVKVQFLLSRVAERRQTTGRNSDPYKLNIGITPALTLWNPYNVPLVLESGAQRAIQLRYFNLPLAIKWKKKWQTEEGESGTFESQPTSLSFISNGARNDGGDRYTGFTGWIGGSRPVVFQPGEVRVFSLNNSINRDEIVNANKYRSHLEMKPGWDPRNFIRLRRSAQGTNARHIDNNALTFKTTDEISFTVEAAGSTQLADGSALQFFLRQGIPGGPNLGWNDRNYQLISRPNGAASGFNLELMRQAFPDGDERLEYKAVTGTQIARKRNIPFLLVSLTAGCEVSGQFGSSEADGRRFASRPFLHSTAIHAAPLLDRADRNALYQHGWNWWVKDVDSFLDANVQVASDNRTGYYGGGYSGLYGSRFVAQQEVPLTPPMSIASLSHARLGGWSLATGKGGAKNSATTISIGGGGLYPHTLQAIGNSYAHPSLKPDEAFTTWDRQFNTSGRSTPIAFADHSYLANKALWDEFFFSSIAPRTTSFYGGDGGSAQETARQAFFEGEHLPNRRLVPLTESFSESDLDEFFDGGRTNRDGELALAQHLLVRGPFNVNSTSVEAWKAVFSSLRSETVANSSNSGVQGGIDISTTSVSGVPVSQFSLPNGGAMESSSDDPADSNQWLGWRTLSDREITQLAEAMVKQVKTRGPFLSLSEFINRRLDSSDKELSLKGALQAALDDEEVDINNGFDITERRMEDNHGLTPAFPEALEGPIAYGSAAYVDQADLLRNMGSLLTPRGDTFLIRAYGDSVDSSGNVVARAWCEAVVQRGTTYLESEDEAWLGQEELNSGVNKEFGRPFRIVSFRWLNEDEV